MFTRRSIPLAAGSVLLAAACGRTPPPGSTSPTTPPPSSVTNTNATVPADPLAGVQNRDRVKRYSDETDFSTPQPAQLITGFATDLRESPSGDSITTLESSEGVSEVARDKRGDYYLVVYPDPRDASKKLAGWVYKGALENTAWATSAASAPAAKLSCAHDEAHLRTDRDFCGKTCTKDDGCDRGAGQRCDGHAFEVSDHGDKHGSVNYCVATGP